MSQYQTQPVTGQPSIKPGGDNTLLLRVKIIIVFMAVMVLGSVIAGVFFGVLLYFDSTAFVGQVAGKQKIEELVDKGRIQNIEASNANPITNETVAHTLGFEPSHTKTEKWYTLEKYTWRGGLHTYNIYAIYVPNPKTGSLKLINVFGNEGVDNAVLPKELPPDYFLEALKAAKPTGPPGSSVPPGVGPTVGPPGGRPGGPGAPGRNPSRPEAEDDAKKAAGDDASK